MAAGPFAVLAMSVFVVAENSNARVAGNSNAALTIGSICQEKGH
jgi:hypothetical protein